MEPDKSAIYRALECAIRETVAGAGSAPADCVAAIAALRTLFEALDCNLEWKPVRGGGWAADPAGIHSGTAVIVTDQGVRLVDRDSTEASVTLALVGAGVWEQ